MAPIHRRRAGVVRSAGRDALPAPQSEPKALMPKCGPSSFVVALPIVAAQPLDGAPQRISRQPSQNVREVQVVLAGFDLAVEALENANYVATSLASGL